MDIQKLIQKSKRPYPQNKMEIRILIVFLVILSFGVLQSIYSECWSHFERSGSLMVILGIFVAWQDITGNIDKHMYELDKVDTRSLDNVKNNKSGLMSELAKTKLIEGLEKGSADMQRYLETRKVRLRTIEAGLLVVGTFIWGYGGSLGSFVHQCA